MLILVVACSVMLLLLKRSIRRGVERGAEEECFAGFLVTIAEC